MNTDAKLLAILTWLATAYTALWHVHSQPWQLGWFIAMAVLFIGAILERNIQFSAVQRNWFATTVILLALNFIYCIVTFPLYFCIGYGTLLALWSFVRFKHIKQVR